MLVHFDPSCDANLRHALLEPRPATNERCWVEATAAEADVIIFGSDNVEYIKSSRSYRAYASKCLCISESDIPTFRLPGLYAANMVSRLTAGRTKTISYFISQRFQGNPEIRKLTGMEHDKRYLYSFMGGANSWPRKRIFRALQSGADTLIEPTDTYNHWQSGIGEAQWRVQRMRRYAEVMASSKFSLCPRGCGLSSYRLFESMSLAVVPVIISDKWKPVEGVDWRFALFVREREIPRIDAIVRSHADEWQQRGKLAQETYRRFFSDEVVPEMVHARALEVLVAYDRQREAVMARLSAARAATRGIYWSAYKVMKLLVLRGYEISGRPLPIQLNRPLAVQLGREEPDLGTPTRMAEMPTDNASGVNTKDCPG